MHALAPQGDTKYIQVYLMDVSSGKQIITQYLTGLQYLNIQKISSHKFVGSKPSATYGSHGGTLNQESKALTNDQEGRTSNLDLCEPVLF